MAKAVVEDAQGVRWVVRARRLREDGAAPIPLEEIWRPQLSAALAPVATGQRGRPAGSALGLSTPDASDDAMAAVRGEIGAPVIPVMNGFEILAGAWRLVVDGVRHLRTPFSDRWRVELVARGRVRRWAHWETDGAEAATRTVAAVATDVAGGRLPEPAGAVPVEVVDQRPPYRSPVV